MRLTVHVAEAKKQKIEVPSKEKPGTFVKKEVLYNTLSFTDVKESDVTRILQEIESTGQGIPVKHYLSTDSIPGINRYKKK